MTTKDKVHAKFPPFLKKQTNNKKKKNRKEDPCRIWMVFGQTAVWLGCTAHLSRDVSHHDPGAEPHLTTDVPEHTSTRIYHVLSTDEVRHQGFKECVSGCCRREHENRIKVIYEAGRGEISSTDRLRGVLFLKSGGCLYSTVSFQ